jgi:glycerol-3-phosphate acyltransferase PlsX
VRVAVDAMGGDHAPGAVIAGAMQASRERSVSVTLVGPAAIIEDHLQQLGGARLPDLVVVDAPDTVAMDESPLAALRRKRRTSIAVAVDLVERGEAHAVFSAGHTGAAVLAARTAFGLLPGALRPAVAVLVPTPASATVLLDAGANLDSRPEHLAQFGLMGAAYARIALNLSDPRVGLLSIGEEPGKGNDLVRDAHRRLAAQPITFIGNLEARDLFTGRADVVVCDGFTGNVALKVGEGLVEAIERMIRDELGAEVVSQLGALLTRRAFARFKQRVDAAAYGGAPLLGVARLLLIGHGRSTPQAIENGVVMAARLAEERMVDRLREALAGSGLA